MKNMAHQLAASGRPGSVVKWRHGFCTVKPLELVKTLNESWLQRNLQKPRRRPALGGRPQGCRVVTNSLHAIENSGNQYKTQKRMKYRSIPYNCRSSGTPPRAWFMRKRSHKPRPWWSPQPSRAGGFGVRWAWRYNLTKLRTKSIFICDLSQWMYGIILFRDQAKFFKFGTKSN